MLKKIFVAISILSVSLSTYADFLVELDAGYGSGEYTTDSDVGPKFTDDISRYNLDGKIYFGLVDTDSTPFQEAGFLSKKSSVSVSLDSLTYDQELGGDYEISENTIAGRFVIPGPNLILMASLVDGEEDYENFNSKKNGYGFGIGFYTGNNGALTIAIEKLDVEFSSPPDDKETTSRINYKHVAGSGSCRVAFEVFGEYYSYEDNYLDTEGNRFSVGGNIMFYINQKLSVGAGLQLDFLDFDFEDGVGAIFTPQVNFDITEKFGIYANIHSEAISYDDDVDDAIDVTSRYINIGARVRL